MQDLSWCQHGSPISCPLPPSLSSFFFCSLFSLPASKHLRKGRLIIIKENRVQERSTLCTPHPSQPCPRLPLSLPLACLISENMFFHLPISLLLLKMASPPSSYLPNLIHTHPPLTLFSPLLFLFTLPHHFTLL